MRRCWSQSLGSVIKSNADFFSFATVSVGMRRRPKRFPTPRAAPVRVRDRTDRRRKRGHRVRPPVRRRHGVSAVQGGAAGTPGKRPQRERVYGRSNWPRCEQTGRPCPKRGTGLPVGSGGADVPGTVDYPVRRARQVWRGSPASRSTGANVPPHLDPQALDAAQHDTVPVAGLGRESDRGEALEQPAKGNTGLQHRQRGAQAVVNAAPEG